MIYIYRVKSEASEAKNIDGAFSRYIDENERENIQIIDDQWQATTSWYDTLLYNLLRELALPSDKIVVYDAPHLTSSILKVTDIFEFMAKRKLTIHFVKYEATVLSAGHMSTLKLLTLYRRMIKDFSSARTRVSLAKRKAKGLRVGRPKGKKNNRLKLDRHQEQIAEYLRIGQSKAAIAKHIGVHPQTIYNYMRNHPRAFSSI